jgi:hypothetical protein
MSSATTTAAQSRPIYDWIVRHDDSKAFVIVYIALALTLSIAISLFWLVALVMVHFAFEYVRYRHHGATAMQAIASASWELKLDAALVMFALVLSLYLQFVLGVLGIQAASRVGTVASKGIKGGTRFAIWENVIRGVLLSLDDAVYALRGYFSLRQQKQVVAATVSPASETKPVAASQALASVETVSEVESPANTVAGSESPDPPAEEAIELMPDLRSLGKGDVLALALGAICLALILAAPWMGHGSFAAVLSIFATELHPFPR